MIYLNNAATSFPKPETVQEAVARCLREPPFQALRTGYASGQTDVMGGVPAGLGRVIPGAPAGADCVHVRRNRVPVPRHLRPGVARPGACRHDGD